MTRCEFLRLAVGIALLGIGSLGSAAAPEENADLNSLKILDVRGKVYAVDSQQRRPGIVFVFISSECPISRQYVPELNRLAKMAAARNVGFFGVISDPTIRRQDALRFVDQFQISFPVLFDASGELADLFKPRYVPEARVVDRGGIVRYTGRIDDLYSDLDKRRKEPNHHDLWDAIVALAEGKTILSIKTEAVGCPFENRGDKMKKTVTYARDIAPILQAHCVECHRPGEVAPFSLLTYADAAKRARNLARVTGRRLMPPWRADAPCNQFLDERRLTPHQIALVQAWSDGGAPEGDLRDLPPAPQFTAGWRLGSPDVVTQVPVPFTVPADGPDIFQHFVIPIKLSKDETLVGFEFRPGNPAVVHHAVLFLDTSGNARKRDAETPEPGWRTSGSIDAGVTSMIGVWTPGMTPRFYPDNVGVPLDKGADVVVQLHLHPSGKAESDQSKIALYFAKKPVKRVLSRSPFLLGSLALEIAPGNARYHANSSVTLPVDISLTSVFPHMHLIGREMKVTATLPDKQVRPLIWIKDWNFYWQDSYIYREPLHLPKGTKIDLDAFYDNSAANPHNPSTPPKRVLFGNGSTDEMCFAIFQSVSDDPSGDRQLRGTLFQSMMEQWATAPLSADARGKIMAEAMNLFGRRRGPARAARKTENRAGKGAPQAGSPSQPPSGPNRRRSAPVSGRG